jgi:hydrogenase maturation factor HypE
MMRKSRASDHWFAHVRDHPAGVTAVIALTVVPLAAGRRSGDPHQAERLDVN